MMGRALIQEVGGVRLFYYICFLCFLLVAGVAFFCIHTYIEWNLMIIGPWRTDRDAAAAGGRWTLDIRIPGSDMVIFTVRV